MPEPLGVELCVPEDEALDGLLAEVEEDDCESGVVSVLAQPARSADSARPANAIVVVFIQGSLSLLIPAFRRARS
jgi:hypothetical protein